MFGWQEILRPVLPYGEQLDVMMISRNEPIGEIAKKWINALKDMADVPSAEQADAATTSSNELLDEILHLPYEEPALAWEFIKAVVAQAPGHKALASLAAGPLEDLLAAHGQEYISAIEGLAKDDSAFRATVRNVWRNTIAPEVWDRLQALCDR